MKRIEIVIVDDHPVFLAGIKEILQKEENIFVSGQAKDGNLAIELVRKLKPHVVVMDITMPGQLKIILIDSVPDILIQAIRKVQQGDIYLDSAIMGLMLISDPPGAPAGKQSILQTKLHRPPVREDIIHRSRIVEVL
jgi:DNA-binding NarL/FixJ family response regulator